MSAYVNSDELLLLSVAAIASSKIIEKKRLPKKRKKWSKNWLLQRKSFSHINLLTELKLEKEDWFNYLRMNEETYLILLKSVKPLIEKEDTVMRKAISSHERLTATLRFLATGRSYEDLKYSTIISPQALSYIIPETCNAIYKTLRKEYIKFPATKEEWAKIANDFENRWNFPHCLGAVDGKHVEIVPPCGSGSYFYNYKGRHSMVLMAIANANYEFIMCDFGTNGRISDGGVLENTIFSDKLINNKLNIPDAEQTMNGTVKLPYVFIGDEAFALRTNFLKPYAQNQLTNERRIFNYRLSRARRIIENVFGIMAARFRLFHTAINLQLDNIEIVVMACCVLHNFLRRNCANSYTESALIEETLSGVFVDVQNGHNRNVSNDAKLVRDMFLEYFNNEGAVEWQNEAANLR